MNDIYTAEEKIRIALDWVAKQEPWVIPVVLTRWAVSAEPNPGKCPTMQTNGRVMNYNPGFVDKLSLSATKCIVLHESAHVINFHCHRRGNRNPKGWNIACDLAINAQLWRGYCAAYSGDNRKLYDELVLSETSGGCFVGFGSFKELPANKSAEEYYDILKSRNPQPPQPPQPSQPQPPQGGGSCTNPDGQDTDPEPNEGDREDDGNANGKGKGRSRSRKPSNKDEEPEEGTWDDVFNGDSDDEGDDDEEGEGQSKSKSKSQPESSDEGEGEGEGINPSDFEDSDSPNGGDPLGNTGKDPFADLPDPTETFGGGVEDAPEEATLRDDEAALILETLLGGDNYGRTGLGDIISKFRQEIEGDPEVAAQVNWRRELEKFLRVQHAAGWKYDRPSRRHGHRSDVVLPARRAKNKTRGLCIVDTSGSMADDECNQAISHLGKILALFPQSTVTLAMCDTAVRSSAEYRASDFPIREFEGWKGRGCTELDPAFRWAKQNKSKYDWIVVVSDMEWSWWSATDPGLPVLWVNTRRELWCGGSHPLPFGKLVNFHAQQTQRLAA